MNHYRFGSFEMAVAERRLTAGHASVDLPFRQFEALRVLVEARGEVVDRDQLHQQIWPGVSVDETSLNKAVSELRRALAAEDETEYVETVRGRGYRLAVPIQTSPASTPPPWRRIAVVAAALALVAAAGVLWQKQARADQVDQLRAEGRRLHQAKQYPEASRVIRQAIALAPGQGAAYSELAHTVHKMRDPSVAPTQAIQLAEKGVELSPDCAECQGTLGFFLFYHGWEWDRARIHYQEALRLDPENPGIRPSYAFLLAATGETRKAVEQAQIAADAQPLAPGRHAALAQVLYLDRQYDQAIAAANRALELDHTRSEAWEYRARAQFRLGQTEEGVRTMLAERYRQHAPEVGAAVDAAGAEAGLRKLLELTDAWPERSNLSWRRAAWLSLLGDDDDALAALEEAVRIRNINLMFVAVDPLYGHLREHPRYQAVLQEMGLASAPPVEVTAR